MTAQGPPIDKAMHGPDRAGIPASLPGNANKHLLVEALLVFVLGCLAGVGWLAYQNMQAATDSERLETHTRVVIQEFGELLSSLKDAETGQRGFIITGNQDYLAPYRAGLEAVPVVLADLRRLTADNPPQQQRLDALEPLIASKFAVLAKTIALSESQGFPAARAAVMAQSGKKHMDDIRALVGQAQAQEAQLLKERSAIRQANSRRTMQSVLLGGALGSLALLLMFIYLRWERAARRLAETAQQASGALLQVATDAAELGIWTWQSDGDRITWENERTYEIVGLTQGDRPVTAARFAAEFVHADDLAAFEQAIINTVQTGARFFYQGRVHRPNGELRWIEFTGQPVSGLDGLRVIGTMCNITGRKQAEEALRKSQETLELAFEIGKTGIWDWDLVADKLVWSERRKALSGLPPDAEMSFPLAMATTHPGDRARFLAARTLALETGTDGEVEFRTVWPNGSVRWLHSRWRGFSDASGQPVRITGVAQDITEQRASEEALRQSEAFSRSILKSSADCVKVLNRDGNLLSMLSGQELLGIEDIRPFLNKSWLDFWINHDDRQEAQAALVAALAGGTGAFVGSFRTLRGEAKWWDVLISPILDDGGKPARLLVVSRDVTARKHAEVALRESEERLRLAAEAAHFGTFDRDLQGGYFHVSTQIKKMLGYEPDAQLDRPQIMSHFHPDDRLAGIAAFRHACDPAGDGQLAIDQRIVLRDGTVRWIASVGRVHFEGGVPKRIVGFWFDVTERSRLERQTQAQAQALVDLHRRKDEFLAMLSHELRNPLAPLTSAAELLRLQENQGPVYRQACDVIERQVGQMKHLIDDLLDVSRITSGNVRLRKAPVCVGDIVERALETTRPLIARRRQQLTLSLPPHPVWLDADATRLEQVLVNLLNNAAKYTEEGGRLWLSVVQEGDAGSAAGAAVAVIKVRDTGMGIAAELLPHIFDLFTQAERSIDRSQGGMGIGLSLVRQLLELHGGSVAVNSVLGQGSEFVVRLPVMQAVEPPLPLPPPVEAPARPAGRRCRVLAVDDSVDAVEFLARLLRLSGHEVEVAYDGPSAVQAALAMRPDVVVLDIGLPGLTGYEVARRLRQEATLKDTVLVALTGYGRESDRQRSKHAGFSYHLVKPAGVREVEEILSSVGEKLALQASPAQAVVPEV
ncbi:CHASE3 domain-containing protein [Polaromonas sp.]|uniref:PAS domain-containing protein n=1 Tax=Polaromonas sp. TaxID=1869339 RepID=UPI0013B79865|nr:CHASE3 domain-containing protein [Polaromonas sp.]NDP63491.1 PAS domain-containing protein [Polaromonas sp.]